MKQTIFSFVIGQVVKFINFLLEENVPKHAVITPKESAPTVKTPVPTPTQTPPQTPKYLFDTPQNARHSVRVLCDEANLSLYNKNVITACIEQESAFKNTAVNHNRDKNGKVLSTDWGICQINDYYHTGVGRAFKNAEDIVNNPEKAVRFMISMLKAGKIKLWVSYSSGAYEKYMPR